jgi:hypothetical protein
MRAKTPLLVALLLTLIFFSFAINVDAANIISDDGIVAPFETTFSPSAEGFTPGTVLRLQSPYDLSDPENPITYDLGYVWLMTVEPLVVKWVIYDSANHIVLEETHEPATKHYDGSDPEYPWRWGDAFEFTIPAFAREGTWLAVCYIYYDGGSQQMNGLIWDVAAGEWFDNIFTAPIYFFNMKLPALFWCLSVVWIPLVIMAILFIYARSAEGIADMLAAARDAGRKAREKWNKKRQTEQKQ